MKKRTQLILTLLIVLVCGGLGVHSYFQHTAFCLATQAYQLHCEDRFQEAIDMADESIWYRSANYPAYYVRGICRYKLAAAEPGDKLPALAKSKADLKRAMELTDEESVVRTCKDFLERIRVYEAEMVQQGD